MAATLGSAVGVLAANAGGRIDALLMRLADLQLSFPAILIALVLLAVFGRGIDKVVIALIAVQWAYYARAIRATALVERRREYMEAARALALPRRSLIFRHLLPNCLPPVIVVATMQVAHAIALEATLSFLGVGVPVTEPSLGLLIKNGYDYLLSGKYWISTFPGLALVIVIVAINLVGDRLRDVLNPNSRIDCLKIMPSEPRMPPPSPLCGGGWPLREQGRERGAPHPDRSRLGAKPASSRCPSPDP